MEDVFSMPLHTSTESVASYSFEFGGELNISPSVASYPFGFGENMNIDSFCCSY